MQLRTLTFCFFAGLTSLVASFALGPGGGEACRAAAERRADAEYDQQLFFAVLEGLYRDGVSNEDVDHITARDPEHGYPANFVWGCPVCMPAYEAFRLYRARPEFTTKKSGGDTFGPGLDPATRGKLDAADVGVRQRAIMALVESWLARRLETQRLTADERAAWRAEMEQRRKKGMAILQEYRASGMKGSYAEMKACPFCDAANGASGKGV